MTIVELTKSEVIRAILEEDRLTKGYWIRVSGENGRSDNLVAVPARSASCFVCAVGAVVKRCMDGSATAAEVLLASQNVHQRSLDYPLCLLSDEFEVSVDEALDDALEEEEGPAALEAGRHAVIRFVRDRFPDVVRIDIGSARPHPSVKIVPSMQEEQEGGD